MAIELLCRKLGMTRIFTEKGEAVPVTVLQAGPNFVVQKKTEKTDGYSALQLGFGEKRRKTTSKPMLGHFEKAKIAPQRHLHESRIGAEDAAAYEAGQEVKVDIFTQGQRVDEQGPRHGRRREAPQVPHAEVDTRHPRGFPFAGLDRSRHLAGARDQGPADGGSHGQ